MEIEKTSKRLAEEKKNEKKNEKRRRAEAEDDDDDDEDDEEKEDKAAKKVEEELELLKTMQQRVEQRKMFLMEQISVKVGAFSNFKWVSRSWFRPEFIGRGSNRSEYEPGSVTTEN